MPGGSIVAVAGGYQVSDLIGASKRLPQSQVLAGCAGFWVPGLGAHDLKSAVR